MVDWFLDHPYVLPVTAVVIALLAVAVNVCTMIFGKGWLL